MVTLIMIGIPLAVVYGLFMLANLRTMQMNQRILNDALSMLRQSGLAKRR